MLGEKPVSGIQTTAHTCSQKVHGQGHLEALLEELVLSTVESEGAVDAEGLGVYLHLQNGSRLLVGLVYEHHL